MILDRFASYTMAGLAAVGALGMGSPVNSQTFTDYPSYCRTMAEMSVPTLMARVTGEPKVKEVGMIAGMTDPSSIRAVRELIEFAYSQPSTMTLDQLEQELIRRCEAREIFVQ